MAQYEVVTLVCDVCDSEEEVEHRHLEIRQKRKVPTKVDGDVCENCWNTVPVPGLIMALKKAMRELAAAS